MSLEMNHLEPLFQELKSYIEEYAHGNDTAIESAYELIANAMINRKFKKDQIQQFFKNFETMSDTKDLFNAVFSFRGPMGSLLDIAIQCRNDEAVGHILDLEGDKPIGDLVESQNIFQLVFNDDRKNLYKLFEKGIDPNQSGAMGKTIQHILINQKNFQFFKDLIERYGDKLDLQATDWDRRTLLHYAVIAQDRDMVDFFLKKGFSPDEPDLFGFSPFSLALYVGNLEIAKKLSSLSEDKLQSDSRWNNPPPSFNHSALVDNISAFLKLKYASTNDPDVQFSAPAIHDGVCNGWSWLVALLASKSLDEKRKFYKMCSIFSKWDGKSESLSTIPDELKDEYANLDEMFLDLTNRIYMFYQQRDLSMGLPRHEREKQLALVSEKRQVQSLCDFCLPELTSEEQAIILKTFNVLANDMIIDVRSRNHDVSYYQKKENEIYYFDPNIRFELPAYGSYQQALEHVTPYMQGRVEAVKYWHAMPEHITPKLASDAKRLMEFLINKLIVQNPKRMETLDNILVTIAYFGVPIMLNQMLNNPNISPHVSKNTLKQIVRIAQLRLNLDVLNIVFKHNYDLKDEDSTTLKKFLRAGILYDNHKLIIESRNELQKRIEADPELNTSEMQQLMKFTPHHQPMQSKPPQFDRRKLDIKAYEQHRSKKQQATAKTPSKQKDFRNR